jgi:flagellar hook-associated protein 1 FlgK
LSTSPESASARSNVISTAQVLAQQLRAMSEDIQALRGDTELGLADAVRRANDAMSTIARINQQLSTTLPNDPTAAALLDERDNYIEQLSQLTDVRVLAGDHNQVSLFTNSGIQLVGLQASSIGFDAQGNITAAAQWSADPTKRSVGTLVLTSPNGDTVDLIANKSVRSGEIAALLEMRDQILPQAQNQLDAFAAAMASALSDRTTAGAAVTAGAQAGFDIATTGMLSGNTIKITYTDTATSTQHVVTVVRVDDPALLPLSDDFTSDPSDQVIGIDFSGGMAGVVTQLNAALGAAGLQFSNPSGSTLRVLDDGAAGATDVDAVSATTTTTTFASGAAEFPFFLDGNNFYTGAATASGSQRIGLAGRLVVNPALIADLTKLVVYQTSPMTAAGDATRPNFIYDRLTNAALEFSPQSGIGAAAAPFTGSLPAYLRQVISQQGEAADAANSLQQGQDVVVTSLQQRFNETAGVNIDTEMANLLGLQTAYSANARVMTAVRDMLNLLLQL